MFMTSVLYLLSVCSSVYLLSLRAFTGVNILGLECNSYMLLRLAIVCLVLKMNCVTFIDRLQGCSKVSVILDTLWFMGENHLRCFLIVLRILKRNEIYIHY